MGNPVISLNPDSLFPFVTISLWKMNFLLPPEALFWASLLLSASISDFSRFPQRWPLPLFSPFCCFLGREVGKDQLFQIGHSNCITNNLTSLLYSDWLLSLQDSWDKLLLTSLASFSVFSTLSTVNSGFISLKAQHLSLFKTESSFFAFPLLFTWMTSTYLPVLNRISHLPKELSLTPQLVFHNPIKSPALSTFPPGARNQHTPLSSPYVALMSSKQWHGTLQ